MKEPTKLKQDKKDAEVKLMFVPKQTKEPEVKQIFVPK